MRLKKMNQKLKETLSLFLKGTAIGTAVIIPGLSGGTIAFLLGIYDRMIHSIIHIKTEFKKSVLFLLPLLIGVIFIVAALLWPIQWAFEYIPLPILSLFAGLVIGGLPSMHKLLKGNYRPINIGLTLIGIVVAAGLGVLSVLTSFDAGLILSEIKLLYVLIIFLVGILASIALIVPGISGSLLLLVIGFYQPLTALLKNLLDSLFNGTLFNNWGPILVVFIFAIGIVVGFILISLTMDKLLKKHQIITYFVITGFIIGSIFSLFFNFEVIDIYKNVIDWWQYLLMAVFLGLGLTSSIFIAKIGNKFNNTKIKT
jgi:putative membrane protein